MRGGEDRWDGREAPSRVTGPRAASWLGSPNQAAGFVLRDVLLLGSSPSEAARGGEGQTSLRGARQTGYEKTTGTRRFDRKNADGTNDGRAWGCVVELTFSSLISVVSEKTRRR